MSPPQFRLPWLVLVLALVFAGCTHPWMVIRASGPPSALKGAQSLSVSFDYADLSILGMGRAKSEAEWVAAKAAEDPTYPQTWETLKGKWEEAFMAGFSHAAPLPVTRTVAGGSPPADGASVVVKMDQLQVGKFIPFNTTLTTVQATFLWSRDGEVVDEIRTISSVAPTLMSPAPVEQVESIGRETGKSNAKFVESKLQ